MVLRDTGMLAAAGLAIGLPLAAAAARWLGDLLHGTSATDPAVLGAVAVVTMVAALLAGYLPARRAARADPLVALRSY